jgi:chromosome segregation ATPase
MHRSDGTDRSAPTHATQLHLAPDAPLRPRWWRWLAAGLAALLVAAGAATVLSYRNGQAWERRASQQTARAEGAERRADELRGQLDKSEANVAQLQRRIDDLADEKAQAEDEREILRVYAERYQQLTRAAGSVTDELSTCIGELADAMSLIGNPYASSSYLDQAVADCQTALDDSQTLQDLIESMPQPPGS